jgi:hypothetical protein
LLDVTSAGSIKVGEGAGFGVRLKILNNQLKNLSILPPFMAC